MEEHWRRRQESLERYRLEYLAKYGNVSANNQDECEDEID